MAHSGTTGLSEAPPLSSMCVFCLRSISRIDFNNERSDLLILRFIKLVERFVGREAHSLKILLKSYKFLVCCDNCEVTISTFCDLYNHLTCLKLQLEWKLEMLISIMKLANRVPSRVQQVKKYFIPLENHGCWEGLDGNPSSSRMQGEDSDNNGAGQKSLKYFKMARHDFIKECARTLSKSQPRVLLSKQEAQDTSPVKLKNDQYSGRGNHLALPPEACFLGWSLSFAAVTFLAFRTDDKEMPRKKCFTEKSVQVDTPADVSEETDLNNLEYDDFDDHQDEGPEQEFIVTTNFQKFQTLSPPPPGQKMHDDVVITEQDFLSDDLEDSSNEKKLPDDTNDSYGNHTENSIGSHDCNEIFSPEYGGLKFQIETKVQIPEDPKPPLFSVTDPAKTSSLSGFCVDSNSQSKSKTNIRKRKKCASRAGRKHRLRRRMKNLSIKKLLTSGLSQHVNKIQSDNKEQIYDNVNSQQNEIKPENGLNGESKITSEIDPEITESFEEPQVKKQKGPIDEVESQDVELDINTSASQRYNLRAGRRTTYFLNADEDGDEYSENNMSDKSNYPSAGEENDPPSNDSFSDEEDEEDGKPELMAGKANDSQRSNKRFRVTHPCLVDSCSEKFYSFEELDTHKQQHGSFKCNFCEKVKRYAPDLALHEINKHAAKLETSIDTDSKESQCPRCTFKFLHHRTREYIRHFLQSHLKLSFPTHTCKICNKQGVDKDFAAAHFRKYHKINGLAPSQIFRCEQCAAYFIEPHQLEHHENSEHFVGKCLECNRSFSKPNLLKKHTECMHPEKQARYAFKCDIGSCRRRFLTKTDLDKHTSSIAHRKDDLLLKCSKCDAIFRGQNKLNRHLRHVHVAPTHTCSECGKSFNTVFRLNTHLACHVSKDKMVKCSKCGNEYKSKRRLDIHIKFVHTTRSHICPECGKAFKTPAYLKVHMEYHKGPEEWKYKCSTCGRKFADPQKLNQHMRTHTKEKPFICQFCGDQYAHRHNWRNHMKTKHREEHEKQHEEGSPLVEDEQRRRNFLARKGSSSRKGDCIIAGKKQQVE